RPANACRRRHPFDTSPLSLRLDSATNPPAVAVTPGHWPSAAVPGPAPGRPWGGQDREEGVDDVGDDGSGHGSVGGQAPVEERAEQPGDSPVEVQRPWQVAGLDTAVEDDPDNPGDFLDHGGFDLG